MGEQTILEEYKIRIALDTQILAYLLDNTYPLLNSFFDKLSSCPFVDLVCSRFATYELLGVRKLEHYLRAIYSTTSSQPGSSMNFASALKYRYDWSAPELDYANIYPQVKANVEDDLRRINDDFSIEFEDRDLHRGIWKPHQDLTLSSKISKEDSLLLLSSVYPNESHREEYLVILTNDDGFYQGYCGNRKIDEVNKVFKAYDLNMPIANKLNKIETPISKKALNLLRDEIEDAELIDYVNSFVLEHIKVKSNESFLGIVAKCGNGENVPNNLFCFTLEESKTLNQNLYLSVVSKELNSIYNHPVQLSEFYNIKKIENYPFVVGKGDNSSGISVALLDEQGNPLGQELIQTISVVGNLVIIHPDSHI